MARILVVDDRPDVRAIVARVLRHAGHEPVIADGGRDAIEKVQNAHADLILLDLSMPEMDGFEVLKRLPAAHVPVVVLSGEQDPAVPGLAMELGAAAFLLKGATTCADILSHIDRFAMRRSGLAN